MKIFINKTLISVFGGLIITTAVQAQDMPPGAIVSYIDCNFRAGVDMEETVRWGRNASRNDWAANQIFYRQPLVKPNGYEHDFRIARYYSSWSEYIERSEEIYTASLDSAPARQRPLPHGPARPVRHRALHRPQPRGPDHRRKGLEEETGPLHR